MRSSNFQRFNSASVLVLLLALFFPIGATVHAACTTKSIIFHNKQGSVVDFTASLSQSICAGATASLRSFSGLGWSRTNYTFAGWATSQANATNHVIAYYDTAPFTYSYLNNTYALYTVWNDVKHVLHYDGMDVTSSIPDDSFGVETAAYVSNGTDGSGSLLISKPGYTLDHWVDGLNRSYSFGDAINGVADLILYPAWVANLYFSYDANGGSGSLPQTDFTANTSASVADPSGSITRDGFTFICWNTSALGSCDVTDPSAYFPGDQLGQGVVLYAIWAQNHTISLHLNPPTGSDTQTSQTIGGMQPITSRTALAYSQSGYDFLGWNTDPSSSVALYTDGQSIIFDGSISDLYAIWKGKTFRVTFNPGTADSGSPSYVDITVPGNITIPNSTYQKTGYVFSTWNSSSDGTGQTFVVGNSLSPISNLSLYPTWTAFNGPAAPTIDRVVLQTPSSYVLRVAHGSVSGFTTTYSTTAPGVTISPEFGSAVDTLTVTGLLPNSGIPISVKYQSGINSISYGVVGSSDLHSSLGSPLDPHFDASTISTSDSSHFQISDSAYDPHWIYGALITDGEGLATYSAGVLSVSGITAPAGQSIHISVISQRENYLDGHNTFEVTVGTAPILTNMTRNVGGYSFEISNFNISNAYSWSSEAASANIASNNLGKIYVRNLAPTLDPHEFQTTVSVLEPATNDHGYTRAYATISGSQVSQTIPKPFKSGSKLLVNPKTTGLFLPTIKLSGPTYLLVCINPKSATPSNYSVDGGLLNQANTGTAGTSDNFPSNKTGFAAAHILNDNLSTSNFAIFGMRSLVQSALNTNSTGLFVHNLNASTKNRWPNGDGITMTFLALGRDDLDLTQTANGFHGTTDDCQLALSQNKVDLIFSPLGVNKAVIQTQSSLRLHR